MENMNTLQLAISEKFGDARFVVINDGIWFFGEDIVKKLGYNLETDTYINYIKRFVKDKYTMKIGSEEQLREGIFNHKELEQGAYLINQNGLIKLIMNSQMKEAKKLQDWVIEEVIPSVLETGKYETPKKEQKQQLNTLQQYAMIFFSDDSLADKAVAIQQVEVSQHEEREQKAKEDIFNLVYDKIKDENERKEVKQRIAEYNRTLGIN